MNFTKRAIATRCLELPIRRAIESVARMGGDGIQLDVRTELNARELSETGRRQFIHALGQFNLQVSSAFLPTRNALCDARNLDQRVSAIKTSMQFARLLGTDVLAIAPGRIPESESADFAALIDVLQELATWGNHVGTTLCLRSGSVVPNDLVSLLAAVDQGPLGIDFDPAASAAAGRDVLSDYATLHTYIKHIRATDTAVGADNSSVEVPLGRGRVPWLELLILLSEAKYDGWLSLERTVGSNKVEDLTAGLEFLNPQLPV